MAESDGLQMQLQNATAADEKHVSYQAFSACPCLHPRIIVSFFIFSLCSFADTFKDILRKRDFEKRHDASYSLESNWERTGIYIFMRINMTPSRTNEAKHPFFDFTE